MSTKKKIETKVVDVDQEIIKSYHELSKFLKIARTAEQIAKNYKLPNVVGAKRLVAKAVAAGFKITTSKSDKVAETVGRRPNVYASAEIVGALVFEPPVKPTAELTPGFEGSECKSLGDFSRRGNP